jgi:hypothetical protein
MSPGNESVYRLPPSPEIDAAWCRISDIGTHVISSKEVHRLGKDSNKAIRVPTSWGYGNDAHIAMLDGIHLVHCLNSMRNSRHINFDYHHLDPVGLECVPHLTHCVKALVEYLMCKPSFEMLTHRLVGWKGRTRGFQPLQLIKSAGTMDDTVMEG